MKALVDQGPRDVRIMQVPDTRIQESTDALERAGCLRSRTVLLEGIADGTGPSQR
jgi:hypothetical protein